MSTIKKKKKKKKEDIINKIIHGGSESSSSNEIQKDDCLRLADLYFNQKNILYSHHSNSFDKFLDETIHEILEHGNNSFFEKIEEDKKINYYFKYENIQIVPPSISGDYERMYPCDARERNLTYCVKLMATVTQMQKITYISDDKVEIRQNGKSEERVPLGYIPICVRSKYCSLLKGNNIEKYNKECSYDPGGYFIVNGSEKVIISLERMCDNKTFAFAKKDGKGKLYTTQINSKSSKYDGLLQVASTKLNKDNTISIKLPILSPVSLFVFFRALGIESDKDIISYIVYDDDINMINLLRYSLDDSYDDNNNLIRTQEEAFEYLITKMKVIKRYSETDLEERKKEKKLHLKYLLMNNFLPHINNDLHTKAYFLGYMINKLLKCRLGYIEPDDRDNYINKRIELPGTLIEDLFRQNYKKMLLECRKFFRKRMGHNRTDDNPINVISQIKPNIIEQGLKASLLTGNWSGKKKGVAQMLQRLTYLQTLSTLRRVNSPSVDPSTNKLTSPRHLHASHIGFICPAETPEGNKTGLVKNLSLIGNITIGIKSQNMIIKDILDKHIQSLLDIEPVELNNRIKVFLNGDWLGTTENGKKLYDLLREKKLNLSIEPTTGITYDVDMGEIRIYTDGGRLFRPILTVKDNELNLKKNHINLISFNNVNNSINTNTWQEFMIRNKGVVEYMDVEEAQFKLVAMSISDLKFMKKKMIKAKQIFQKRKLNNNNTINRYGDGYFVKYTHCEIHPSLLLGLITSNIPFCNHNQGPRNIYQYSQARQAMGIYTSNHRYRLDISHLLYNPQIPLVNTHAMRYTNAHKLPSGENVIVAIMTYTGYNQEDSVIVNESALNTGLFRSTSFKKASSVIQKNQTTSKDDIFTKPDRETVTGMRSGSYEKLNEKGYVEEETVINNNDIILAKVSPIQTFGNSTKMYKDNSEHYKSGVPGIVDKVFTNILNHDGYEMRKMRIRSERVPRIGDKFCSRHGQKGTIGITLPACDMPFTKNGLQPDIIMNPNAIPSRMTVGQLVEGLVSKLCAHLGLIGDGTPFNNIDVDAIKDELERQGLDRNGEEYLYNGMTGQKMKAKIFIVPTYYQRLKHMVADKEHSRARGPRTLLTRQAPEGRSRDGGLRFGEMERDCVISHGMAKFLKERMVDTADGFSIHVCTTCGYFAKRMMKNEITPYGSKNDIYKCSCSTCKFPDIYKIRIPYAFKLLIQELKSMNIAAKIRVKTD